MRGWVASPVLLTHSTVVITAHVIKQSLRGTGARLFAEGWRDAVPMLLGTKESRSSLLKIDTHFTPTLRRFMVANVVSSVRCRPAGFDSESTVRGSVLP